MNIPAPLAQPWPARGWPLLADEEAALAATLAEVKPAKYRRSAATQVLNMCRFGATVEQVREVCPGLTLEDLAGGYLRLHALFERSRKAWLELAERAEDGVELVSAIRSSYRVLLPIAPVPAERLKMALSSEKMAHSTFRHIYAKASELQASVRKVESRLAVMRDAGASASALRREGELLWSPPLNGLWVESGFLPTRPGQLSSIRSRLLLDGTLHLGRAVT